MREEDFQTEIERLNNGIPGSKYSIEQLMRIRTFVIDLPIYDFRRMINRFLDEKRTKPLPADFRESARSINSSRVIREDRSPGNRFPNCGICGDSGYARAFSKSRKSEEIFFCKCSKGSNPDPRRKLARWRDEYSKYYDLEKLYPYDEKYYVEFAQMIKVPGVASELGKRKLTGKSSDFSFIFDENWQKKNRGAKAGLINLLQGLKNEI